MSRLWNSQDEKYIYEENLKLKRTTIENLINKINANIRYELNIVNIMDHYDKLMDNFIEYLKNNNVDYFSPTYNKKNNLYEVLDEYIKRASNELKKINNKLINPKYEELSNTKLILLIIEKNINKYNSIIKEFSELKILDLC